MEQYVSEALARGLQEICFTPHIPLPGFARGPEGLRMEPRDAERYFREIERLRARYPQLSILCGVEADFYDGFEKSVEEFLGSYPLDLVLMSVHFVRDWPGENWVFGFDFPDRPLAAVYHDYFQALKRGIASGLYDAVAHLDLIRQPGHPVLATNSGDVEEVLALAARAGMSLEINTAGHAPLLEAALSPAGDPASGRRAGPRRDHRLGRAPAAPGRARLRRGGRVDRRLPRPAAGALPRPAALPAGGGSPPAGDRRSGQATPSRRTCRRAGLSRPAGP